ncbi:IF2 family translation initiation factor [Mycolicibacterium holsaticum]|uniref:IF2 family translation initiation factor n=1 Tax=Mycolicibacterium holsaticum TaxID=152142 RepID=A0A1E3RSX2_9MYCO|nr:IF2 family translation initiation factor [Mycolicibacterium holsaticum]ODQ92930.1 IF2 family translation initiation factor [Mycolicibacterium holsaticum]
MKITDVPFAVLRFQYQLARFPLQVIEDRVVAKMDSEAPARLFYERSLGKLDVTVGSVLDAPEVEQRGTALIERSDALRRAVQLEETATQRVKQANTELKETREQATEAKSQARADKDRQIKQAQTDAQRRNRAAVENAEQRISSGSKRADDAAAQRKNSAESAKNQERAEITKAEQRVTAAATAKLDDSTDKRIAAANKRAQADQMEQLADAEKRKRQADGESSG